MIQILALDTKIHGDALTTFLSKKGVDYRILDSDSNMLEYDALVFDIQINEESAVKANVRINYDTVCLSFNCPYDGYDIGRNEFYKLEVI